MRTKPGQTSHHRVNPSTKIGRIWNHNGTEWPPMFGFLKKSPVEKLEIEHKRLLTKAFEAQRNGDIESYSFLTADAEAVRENIERLKRDGAQKA